MDPRRHVALDRRPEAAQFPLGARRAAGIAAALAFALQGGCASTPPAPTGEMRAHLGTVAIVAVRDVPASNFVTFAKNPLSGAARGAATAAAPILILGIPASAATGGIGAAILAAMSALYAGVGAGAGAVSGALQAMPPQKAREIEQAIAEAVAKLDAQQKLAGELRWAAQKEPAVRLHADAASADTLLEAAVTEIGFETCPQSGFSCPSKERLIGLFVKARARLLRASDAAELHARTFWHESRARSFQAWGADGGQALEEAFELAWRDLASRIVDELFLVAALPPSSSLFATRSDPYLGHCWLRPLQPTAAAPEVDSRQPELRWESFPRPLDRADLRGVSYDLRLWQVEEGAPGRIVYERSGLAEPSHRIERALEPGREYAWSFRARFLQDGRPMATRWSLRNFSGSWEFGPRDEAGAHLLEVCQSDQIMPWLLYRLVTPRLKEQGSSTLPRHPLPSPSVQRS